MRFFAYDFFKDWAPPKSLPRYLFKFGIIFVEIIAILIESLLLVIAESRYSPYCSIWRVATPHIIKAGSYKCMSYVRNLGLPFFAETRFSLYCLIQTVINPLQQLLEGITVDSGESLLKSLGDSHYLQSGIEATNHLFIRKILKVSN
jgi:hypothetical protein